MNKFVIVAGTRPEIIKVAPIIRKLIEKKKDFKFIYSGQHYDHRLSTQIINDLELPIPDFSLKLKSKTPSTQIAEIMTNLEKQIGTKNDIVLAQGDTNSVLATALLAVKLKRKIGHIEAGLRSFVGSCRRDIIEEWWIIFQISYSHQPETRKKIYLMKM